MQQFLVFTCLVAAAFAASVSTGPSEVDAFLANSNSEHASLDQALEKIKQLNSEKQDMANLVEQLNQQLASQKSSITQSEIDSFLQGQRRAMMQQASQDLATYDYYTTSPPAVASTAAAGTTTPAPAADVGGAVAGGVIGGLAGLFILFQLYRKCCHSSKAFWNPCGGGEGGGSAMTQGGTQNT